MANKLLMKSDSLLSIDSRGIIKSLCALTCPNKGSGVANDAHYFMCGPNHDYEVSQMSWRDIDSDGKKLSWWNTFLLIIECETYFSRATLFILETNWIFKGRTWKLFICRFLIESGPRTYSDANSADSTEVILQNFSWIKFIRNPWIRRPNKFGIWKFPVFMSDCDIFWRIGNCGHEIELLSGFVMFMDSYGWD